MYQVDMQSASNDFLHCWKSGGIHLNTQVDGGIQSWLRAHPHPPFLEHLSFRLGNQLFFVRIEDAEGKLQVPGSREGLQAIADACHGHACLMPMKKKFFGGDWVPMLPGWGLVDATSGMAVNPIELVTDEKIEMTPWELQDLAVQVVRGQLEQEGHQIMSWQSNPEVHPAIWFVGKSEKPEWIIVRAVSHDGGLDRPGNWDAIAASCAHLSSIGHFAPVILGSAGEASERGVILRGRGVEVRYEGFLEIQ